MFIPLTKTFSLEQLSRFTLTTTSLTRSFTKQLWPSKATHPIYTIFQDYSKVISSQAQPVATAVTLFLSPRTSQCGAAWRSQLCGSALWLRWCGYACCRGGQQGWREDNVIFRGGICPAHPCLWRAYWQPTGRPECLGLGRLSKRLPPLPVASTYASLLFSLHPPSSKAVMVKGLYALLVTLTAPQTCTTNLVPTYQPCK